MVPRCQKCNADRRKVIIVRNGVGHVTDVELDVSGALSQCPSGDPAQQVQSSSKIGGDAPCPPDRIFGFVMFYDLIITTIRSKASQKHKKQCWRSITVIIYKS